MAVRIRDVTPAGILEAMPGGEAVRISSALQVRSAASSAGTKTHNKVAANYSGDEFVVMAFLS